jgi:flagellar basal-body rod modification protein FlgD
MSTTTSSVSSQLSDLPEVGSNTTTNTSRNSLGKDEFMRLLTTQMQYQDPLNPVDNSQMLAQLAQFSQLEQLQGLSSKIDSMVTASAANTQMSATQLVGKQALFEADRIGLVAGSKSTFTLSLAGDSVDTTAVISDANGRVVRTVNFGSRSAGESSEFWDGLDDTGAPLPSGEYYLSVAGTKADGSEVLAAASVKATITGVEYDNGVAMLKVAGRTIPLSSVLEISLPSTSA